MNLMPNQGVEIWGGMECTINRVQNAYFDQLNLSGHRYREGDINLFASLGFKKMRYPLLWERHKPLNHEAINWESSESKLLALRNHNIEVIAGLVHHGSGPSYVEIAEDSFADGLAAYASEVAKKFPWINYYTPVNEPLTTARFCGLYGLWYPHKSDDAGFCRILINECKATVLAMAAIRVYNPDAQLVQTDDLAKIHSSPALGYQANFENERRWLSYDLLCGRVNSNHPLWGYLTGYGITPEELAYFCANPCPPNILGVNYYLTSERYLDENKENYPVHTHGGNGKHSYADVEAVRVSQARPAGIRQLLTEAWERYNIPIAVTEVHLHCTREEQMRWLSEIWTEANYLNKHGIPILAITPWALLGSFGWDQLLTRPAGTYESGVFDLHGGYPRPTILAEMIKAYSNNKAFDHPVLHSPGWWHRPCRVSYGETCFWLSPERAGPTLIISGTRAAELAAICRRRWLNCKVKEDSTPGDDEWATIEINDWLEASITGYANFFVYLPQDKDIDRFLNTTLDLLLDGECGYWEISADGMIRKQISEHLPVKHFLAG